ncbi:hypothetical protein OS493_016939 [Desmophyllum pertusum]|uniref:Apple domain-containing protein n=1 Tax=Desmophyllum pertusum TaxID=174260 RepID=A0A9X0CK21_9CNID|nr:hypothetical protein OS493_016939 [Desmophyllum pertusum]
MATCPLFPASFLALLFAWLVRCEDTCRILEFTEPEADSYLEHHVIQSTLVDNNGQCEINCYVERMCLSFNLGMLGSGDKLLCELSDSDHYQHPEIWFPKKASRIIQRRSCVMACLVLMLPPVYPINKETFVVFVPLIGLK